MKRYALTILVLLVLITACTNKEPEKDKNEVYGTWDVVDLGDYTLQIVSITYGTLVREDVINIGDIMISKYEEAKDDNGEAHYLTVKYRFDFEKGLENAPDNFHKIFLTSDITGGNKGVQLGDPRRGESDDSMEISVSKFVEPGIDKYYLVYESKPDYTQYVMAIALTNFLDKDTVFRPELR